MTAKGSGDVILKVTLDPADACDDITWEATGATITSPAVGSNKCTAKVSRATSLKIPVKIKCNGEVLWEGFIWVVWSTISETAADDYINDNGFRLRITMGYSKFTHTISPTTIITDVDIPDLTGAGSTVPPTNGLNYGGASITDGAPKKWDNSRQIHQKFINPSNIPNEDIPGNDWLATTYPNYPSATDGDGRPEGAGAIDASLVPLVGNDDAGTLSQGDNDPYSDPDKGKLIGGDTPSRSMLHANGDNGDTIERRLHFIEFTRLDIGGTWYRISDDFFWRIHIKMKKVDGKWTNDGSSKALNNTGF